MKFRIEVDVELDGLELEQFDRLALEHLVREAAEDHLDSIFEDRTGKNEGKIKVSSNLIGPYDREKKHPADLQIFRAADGADLFCAVIRMPNATDETGYRKTFIQWGCETDTIKDYGSVEGFFNHIDSHLVEQDGKFHEEEFLHTQKMGVFYTGWIEIPGVPE